MAVSRQPALTPSSDEGLDDEIASRGETKWKRFHPFRVVRKIFRRRIKREETRVSDASKKSWSTSELQSVQDNGTGKHEVTSPLKIGISLSHDSIFSPESNSTSVSSEVLNIPHGSSLSVHHSTIKNMFKDELFTRVRARRDSDDDAGLPHSPCTSPTTVDVFIQGLKEKSSYSRTTCSAGSLISMGSSENDEDSAGQSSGHSSRMSLIDRKSLDSDCDTDSGLSMPLNHNAAHHKIAVRPKRTYGLPRRRMNQIAAIKMNTLPSTPEVTEDCVKSFQKSNTIEVAKIFREVSVSSSEVSTSLQSSERHQSRMSSSFSCNEVSDLTKETYLQKEKYTSESSSWVLKESLEDNSKLLNDEIIKKLNIENLVLKGQSGKTNNSSVGKNYENTTKDELSQNSDSKTEFYSNQVDIAADSSLQVESNSFENTYQILKETNQIVHEENRTLLKVSSLVKNLENSESLKTCEKLSNMREESKNTFYMNSVTNTNINANASQNEGMISTYDKLTEHSEPHRQVGTSEPLKTEMSEQIVNNYYSLEINRDLRQAETSEKLDIDSEFVLKPIKRNISTGCDSELVFKDNANEIENTYLPSLYFEEESIMSSKSLSLGVEETGVFVSHHASVETNLDNAVVTEARNFAAVEENIGVFTPATYEINLDKDDHELWISSIDVPASIKLDGDVTVNSSTSTLCDSKMLDEKITISVNSKSEIAESITNINKQEKTKQSQPNTPLVLQQENKHTLKEKIATKTQKSHFKEASSNVTNMKNISTQKRVSVEIVPFSQRVKERKYQPISYTNKDDILNQSKAVINSEVGRNLSDQKVLERNKDSDKSSCRHSFSGALTTDTDKEVSTKTAVKPEKVQYPVQIRVYKSVSKPELKDKVQNNLTKDKNISNKSSLIEVKFQMQAAKLTNNEVKVLKEEKNSHENASKWEVKIQSSVPNSNNIQSASEENFCSPVSETNLQVRNNCQKSSQEDTSSNYLQLHQETESSSVKSRENSWKGSKEVPTPNLDEPEPELLRVFARRSIKQKHCDKGKEQIQEITSDHASIDDSSQIVCDTKKESNDIGGSVSKPHITKSELKKKSKSFCEKEKNPRSVSPLKEINLIHGDSFAKLNADSSVSSETKHPRQRLASVPDIQVNLPPDYSKTFQKLPISECSLTLPMKEEIVHKITNTAVPILSESTNGSLISISMVKDCQDVMNDKEPHAPSWLQLAQQRRELREQRERLLLGGSPNSFMDASNKPTRSSKVWDMVNNFQKLQMT